MPTRSATADETQQTVATTSGARVGRIPAHSADVFLARLGLHDPEVIDVALGALQDDGELIGVAALGNVTADRAVAIVAVATHRRRLRVGSDLLHALVAEASRRGLRRMRVTYPSGHAAAADALVRGSGFVTARRIGHGTVTAILLVPDVS